MSAGVVEIGWIELVCAAGFMIVAALISWKFELGQTKNIAVSTLRCFLQLLACGFLLGYLFQLQTWWLVIVVLLCMVAAATQIATSRVKNSVRGLRIPVFASILLSSLAVLFIVVDGVVHADPWYNAREVIPIAGMMTGQVLAGADPLAAAKYQILMLMVITAANAITIMMACFLTYKKRFAEKGYYLEKGLRG